MANICDNKFFFSCENHFKDYCEKFNELFKDQLDGEITYSDAYSENGGNLEGYFESRWTFPISVFEDIFHTEDCAYFRCLSEEYGCGYVAMNIFDKNGWRGEQCFDI